MKYRINGFDQIKQFYSVVFEQKYNIKPQHISLYIFLINQNNRNNWVEWFKCPFDLAMSGACIGSKSTYYKCLTDLQDWGFIKYEKGVNDWKAPRIKIEVLKCTSTYTATVPQSEPLPIQAAEPLPIHIYKLITNNIKPITDNFNAFKDFVLDLGNEINITDNDIKEIYSLYPTKCPTKGSSTGKTSKNKDKIKALLSKDYTFEDLKAIIERYVSECKKDKVFMKNFATFLNNIPDYSEPEKPSGFRDILPEHERVSLDNNQEYVLGGKLTQAVTHKWITIDQAIEQLINDPNNTIPHDTIRRTFNR